MCEEGSISWKKLQQKCVNRRNLIRGAAGTAVGAGLFHSKLVYANDDDGDSERAGCVGPNPIPGGVTGLKPFGIFIHHNPLSPLTSLPDISDPSQITDFDGFVGTNAHPRRWDRDRYSDRRHHTTGVSGGHGLQPGQVHRYGWPHPRGHVRLCLTGFVHRSGWIGNARSTDSRLQRARGPG